MGWAWKETFNNGGWLGVVLNLCKKTELSDRSSMYCAACVWADVHELPGVTHGVGLKIEIEHAWNLRRSTEH